LGGARIVDSEDPSSALGNIKPRQIMAISDAVLDFRRDLDVQLSTNIGEDQLLFRRSENGAAIQKSPYEIAGKASQAAIGVACSMGTRVHPVNLVKVGLDAMKVELLTDVLRETVLALRATEQFSHSQVMSVLFAQDLDTWDKRKKSKPVREQLVGLRQFESCPKNHPDAFDLRDYAVGTLKNDKGELMFTDPSQVSLSALIKCGVLSAGSNDAFVRTTELYPHSTFFPGLAEGRGKTNQAVIQAMVDATVRAEANAIMIDTSILSKTTQICCVDTAGGGMIDLNRFDIQNGMANQGILSLEDLKFFVNYCHYCGIAANLAGSVTSYQAQQLWVLLPELDQASTRGSASAVVDDPSGTQGESANTRQSRIIRRRLVRGIAPPEHGGVLNIPDTMRGNPEAMRAVGELREMVRRRRRELGLPDLESYFVDIYGNPTPIA